MRRTALYTLEVTLTDGLVSDEFVRANPVVSRTIEIRSDQTLAQLHRTIFDAFGRWDDCHLSEFNLGSGVRDKKGDRFVLQFIYDEAKEQALFGEKTPTGSMERTRIGKLSLQVGQEFWYWYDFGDNWVHRITVLAIGEAEAGVEYPRVVANVGDSPPQYMDWDENGMEDDGADTDGVPNADRLVAAGGIEEGAMPLPDGSEVPWRHELVSPEKAAFLAEEAGGRTYRVTTLQEFDDGTCLLGTYLVPGPWLSICLRVISHSEGEAVLSVGAE